MPPTQSEQDDFLKDFPQQQVDILEQPLVEPTEPVATEQAATEPTEVAPNRRERRLADKLQAERESSIALAARLEGITEAQRLQRESAPSEYVKQIEKIFGTASPEAQEATNLLVSAVKGAEDRATERALDAFREEQRKQAEDAKKEEGALDDMVGDIEDTYNVTLDAATQKSFFTALERVSPKDKNGEVIAYADPHAVWEDMQTRRTQPTQQQTRARGLATRGMTQTGAQATTTVQEDAQERWLKDNGII